MSSNLPAPYVGAAVRRLNRETAWAVGKTNMAAVRALNRIDAVGVTTQRAMTEAAHLKSLEAHLLQAEPLGEANYQYLANKGIFALGVVIDDLVREM